MKISYLILFTVLSFHLHAQEPGDTTGIKLFNRGLSHYNNGNLDSTLILWTRIVDNKIGIHYDTYGNAFFNIPTVYWQLKNFEKAKEWYKKILESDLRDNDETGDLMEPHTNYKHKSAVALAGLYQKDSNFTAVLDCLNQADTLYRYWGFEGSAINVTQEQAYLLAWKVEAMRKLNQTNLAIKTILTELICANRLENFFSKSEDTLLMLIDKKTFKQAFNQAIDQMTLHQLTDSTFKASFKLYGLIYEISISNFYPNRNLPHYWTIYFVEQNSKPDKVQLINYIEERSFYKRLTE